MSVRTEETGLSHRRAIIVGAGQAGLAVAAELALRGLVPQRHFVVLDRARAVRSWGSRWHSMRLLSEARHSALASLPFPGDPQRRPRVDEMVSYLAEYDKRIGVVPKWRVEATGVRRVRNGTTLVLSTNVGDVQTRNVVCATGAFARPSMPSWAAGLTVPGVSLHSSAYQFPRQVPAGDVLIVGGGNAGVQLARELIISHRVTLATRGHRHHRSARSYPSAAGGRPRLFAAGRLREPVFGDSYAALQEAGVEVVAGATTARGSEVLLADGRVLSPTSVIFATGYSPGDDWLPSDVRDQPGKRTRTSMPGLFIAGMPRYGHQGADTIHGVLRDAAAVARHIIERP